MKMQLRKLGGAQPCTDWRLERTASGPGSQHIRTQDDARFSSLRAKSWPLRAGTARGPRSCARSSGFTLIEIMVVVVILGILAATIIPQFIGTTQDAKVSAAKATIAELESSLGRFFIHLDRYPTDEEGLKVLVEPPSGEQERWRGPYIKVLRPDPWGNPYQYKNPGVHLPSSFDLWSRGAGGADGGEKDAADIGNW